MTKKNDFGLSKFGVVTLCGSTKFKSLFETEAIRLSLAGYVVLTCNIFSHVDAINLTEAEITMIKAIHFQKIDMSDGIYVINKDMYIGDGTKREIEYAKNTGKTVTYMF